MLTFKISVFRASKKGLKSCTFALAFVSDGYTNAMRSDEDSLRRLSALLESTKHRYNVPIFLSYPEISRFKKTVYIRKRLLYFRKSD